MINFFKEGVRFRISHREALAKWIVKAFRENNLSAENVNYIFCSDRYLLSMNKNFLKHHYFTDVISFDNSSVKGKVEGDIFISIDRIEANAKKFKASFNDELHRVMIHGALHLIGYDDKNAKAKKAMKEAEDYWLKKRSFVQK